MEDFPMKMVMRALVWVVAVGIPGTVLAQSPKQAEQTASAGTTAVSKSEEILLWPCEKKLIELTNAERNRHGLPPLALEKGLLTSARNHCYWMASSGNFQHTTAQVAENIAMGQSTCEEAVQAFMNSPGHRANMLGRYTRIGSAAYQTQGGTIYWCLQFLH